MKKLKYIKSGLFILFCAIALTASNVTFEPVIAQPTATAVSEIETTDLKGTVSPLAIVANPSFYKNKYVTMNARFDKFSTLGLDYKSAFKSSEDYISFLIKRDDTQYDIPLSEMKLFLKRELAEKFIDLKSDDEIFIKGHVFSDALGDAWIDVSDLTITKKVPEKDGVN